MYKAFKGGDEAKQELDKQLAAFENELKDGNKKFIGGEPFIIKQMIQILFLFTAFNGGNCTHFYCSSNFLPSGTSPP